MDGGFPESQGAEGDNSAEDKRGFRGTSENAKTKICMRWRAGHCRFGDRCNFAHGDEELRKLPARGEAEAQERGGDYGGRGGYGQGYGQGSAGGRGNGGYNGYSYRGGYGGGAGGYSNPGSVGGGQYRGGRGGMSDARQMNNQQNPLWAAQGFPISGPGGWTQYRAPDSGEPYYHNQRSGETTWDKPAGWGP